jgi:hypothetical protein
VPIADAYATDEEYRTAITQSSGSDSVAIARDLLAVSRYIDHKLDRPSGFNKDAAATARIYMPKSSGRPLRDDWAESENPWKYGGLSRVLDVQDIVTLTSIEIDQGMDGTYSQTLVANDYELLPRNAAVGPEVKPYSQIGLTEWGSQRAWAPRQRVKVTAVHGWPAVPAAIKSATIILTSIIQLKSPFATGRITEMDAVIEASPQARAILQGLMTDYHAGTRF